MASTAWSDLFNQTTGVPLSVATGITGATVEVAFETLPTTLLDTEADFAGMIPVKTGRDILLMIIDVPDADGGAALDMDVILRTWTNAGVAVDTILWNAGAAFQSAVADKIIRPTAATRRVPTSKDGYGVIGFYVNTAANTPQETAASLVAIIR